MRWRIVRLIWLRELRDQLRDRRTLFMIVVLPLLLYPILGFAVLQFALGFQGRPNVIGFVRGPGKSLDFPERVPAGSGLSPGPAVAWLSVAANGCGPLEQTAGAITLAGASKHILDFPLLIDDGRFVGANPHRLEVVFLDTKQSAPGQSKVVDLIVSAPSDFYAALTRSGADLNNELPSVELLSPRDDDRARQAFTRFLPLLENWKTELKKVRLARRGLPGEFDTPFTLRIPGTPSDRTERLLLLLIRVFPFMLVMWSLAGALYPAVDLCAGEKERGTMETLLISPAGREEIVVGKFLAIWLFSAATSLMNLASMGLTTWQFGTQFLQASVSLGALLWCVVLALPLSAFFSAVSLAIGAYARSSKEGQYYLMPLFIITMPLIFLTLAPGVELNERGSFYSLVPVTGVALLMQRLMTAPTLDQVPWLYFIPVLAPMALYSWVALRWAIFQFQREEVLFREAERLDIRLWLRRLFREKEALPTAGQAFFCFALIVGLRWLSLGMGTHVSALVHSGISLMAFVAAPALFMVLLLNTQPRQALWIRWPQPREIGLAAVLALLFLPPLAWAVSEVYERFPNVPRLLEDRQPLVHELRTLGLRSPNERPSMLSYVVVFGLIASVCEELAFRGFILTGLLRVMRPRNAILLCSFLFALYHMNVFQFLPAFFLGVVLGLLTVRSKSLVPPIIFHLLHNSMLIISAYTVQTGVPGWLTAIWPMVITSCLVIGLSLLWQLYRRPYRTPGDVKA